MGSLIAGPFAGRLMAEMPVNAAARELREHDTRMWCIFRHYEVKNYLEIRETLEGLIARSAAQHITDKELMRWSRSYPEWKISWSITSLTNIRN